MKKAAILQSNYIPWKGYFDLIAAADEFIIYDDAQYTREDWRNRNQIKTPNGLLWLTIPTKQKGKLGQKIRDTEIAGDAWQAKHWKSLCMNYKKSAHFDAIAQWLEPLYRKNYNTITEVNLSFIHAICSFLCIKTKISQSCDYSLIDGKTEKLVSLCQQSGAAEYISGPAAKSYLKTDLFDAVGIEVTWFDYQGYQEYPQLWGDFVHGVSILDLLFNCGRDATRFMRHAPK